MNDSEVSRHEQPREPQAPSAPDGSVATTSALHRLAATVERLNEALAAAEESAAARAVVECATGVVMERLRLDSLQARAQLEYLARAGGRPLLEIAADILGEVAQDPLAEVARHRAADAEDPVTGTRTAEATVRDGSDPQRAVEALLEHALLPLGAHAAALWALSADGSLALVGSAGFHDPDFAGWQHVPPGMPTLAQEAVRLRTLQWGRPSARLLTPRGSHRTHERAAMPATRIGRVLGALEVCWPASTPPARTPRTEQQLDALAELCAHTLGRSFEPQGDQAGAGDRITLTRLADSLHDPAVVLTPLLDRRGQLLDFRLAHTNGRFVDPAGRPTALVAGLPLLQAYPLAAEPGGLFEEVERVHATGESFRAENMTITTLVDQVRVSALASVGISRVEDAVLLTWRLHDRDSRLANLLQHAQRLGRIGGFEDDLVGLTTTWNPQLFDLYGMPSTATPFPLSQLRSLVHPDDQDALDSLLSTLMRYRRPAGAALRMQRADQVTRHLRIVAEPVLDHLGELVAVRGACQDVSAHHWTEIALSATRGRLAQSEAQVAERAQLTRRLQRAIMPPTPHATDTAGLRIAVRYRPAHQDHLVGGDWYDAVPLPNGTLLLAVGDVAGHGIEAATGMVALRNALRGLATTGAGPAQLLGWLNSVAIHLTDHVTATAVCGIYDPAERLLRWSRAGHLPPVLLRDGSPRSLDAGHGILLGALPDRTYTEGTLRLADGDTLLLFTDGLIERKQHNGEEDLRRTLTGRAFLRHTTLTDQLDHLLAHSASDTDDDTCLIGVHVLRDPSG